MRVGCRGQRLNNCCCNSGSGSGRRRARAVRALRAHLSSSSRRLSTATRRSVFSKGLATCCIITPEPSGQARVCRCRPGCPLRVSKDFAGGALRHCKHLRMPCGCQSGADAAAATTAGLLVALLWHLTGLQARGH